MYDCMCKCISYQLSYLCEDPPCDWDMSTKLSTRGCPGLAAQSPARGKPGHVVTCRGVVVVNERCHGDHMGYHLVMTNIAMENCPFIDDFPSYEPPFIVDSPWLC